MDEFIAVLKRVRRWRAPALVTRSPLPAAELARGYYFRQWQADGRNHDKRLFLKSLRNRSPYSSVMPDQSSAPEVEYVYADAPAEGMGAAHLLGGLAVSLPLGPDGDWEGAWVDLLARTVSEGQDGDLVWGEQSVSVRHASRTGHLAEHEAWACAVGLDALDRAEDLWRERGDFFPHLQFLPRVEDDLKALERPWFLQVRGLLARLERSVAFWDPAAATVPEWQGAKVTPEHEQRKRICNFADLDGEVRCFHLHARFTPGAGRLHFRLVPEEKSLRVAYIGRKRERS